MRRGAALLLALALGVVLAAGCGGGDDESGAAAPSDRGKALFTTDAQPPCGSCHVLADAGTSGTVGPNLDTLQPTAARVANAMRDGPGAMPSFSDTLSDEDIDAVATYVESAAGG
jgi:sulfite dehydrogenase